MLRTVLVNLPLRSINSSISFCCKIINNKIRFFAQFTTTKHHPVIQKIMNGDGINDLDKILL